MREAPPNIDELGNLILLQQALEILASPEDLQRSLYPEDRDPAREMGLLFRDAWERVLPVFEPLLPEPAASALARIDAALAAESVDAVDWSAIRRDAGTAKAALPGAGGRSGAPRAWPDQIVRARNRLLHRRQL